MQAGQNAQSGNLQPEMQLLTELLNQSHSTEDNPRLLGQEMNLLIQVLGQGV
jgi:hypothetical protein